jgi:hypothetical protein
MIEYNGQAPAAPATSSLQLWFAAVSARQPLKLRVDPTPTIFSSAYTNFLLPFNRVRTLVLSAGSF